jgi:lipopolysaccharide/colanic/teichoic acid biosynthesis glycosyltransferase
LNLLPQFYNVLIGDLSVIGPKPLFEFEFNHLKPSQAERLIATPGITGFWQLYGRRKKQFKFDEMIKMDIEYIRNQSFSLDFKILLGTIITGFMGESAY